MKKFSTILAFVAIAPLLSACAPTPEKICDHMIVLAEKVEKGEKDEDAKKPSDDDKKKMREKCIERVEEEKKEIGEEKFNEIGKCMLDAADFEALGECEKKAKKDEKDEKEE